MSDIEILKRRLDRELRARKEAERLLEEKSRQLYEVNNKLKILNADLSVKIEQRTAKIVKGEKRYRELVELASDIIYQCNHKGELKYANPVAEKLSGYSFEELKGKHFLELIHKDYRDKVSKFYYNQLQNQTPSTYYEFPINTSDGTLVWVGQNVNTHISEDGSIEFMVLARDISELVIARDALQRSEEKYRSIIENLELGLLEVDLEDNIVRAYPKFCLLSGYSEAELIGKNASNTLLPEEFKTVMSEQREKRNVGEAGVFEVQLIKKSGERIWVIISGAPFFALDGQVEGTIGIHLDISDRKKLEDEWRRAKELAENSVQSKELFMANMSHEIRTPMNAIIGMSELLVNTPLAPKQTDYVSAIKTSADNLLIIINDILDFTKIEAGKMDLDVVPTDLKILLTNSAKTLELKAEEKGIVLKTAFDHTISNYFLDPTRLNQVILNLLSNGVKFTEHGSVSIICKVISETDDHSVLRFSVIDTGIGIPSDKLTAVFESFSQAERSTARKFGGTGLGLPISKQLVDMMGGTLEVDSTFNIGSQFYFTLELKKAKAPIKRMESEDTQRDQLTGFKVLLVEDHEINRFMAVTILENWHCIVTTAENGLKALECLEHDTFDIILMDMMMPEMDGIEATHEIRSTLKLDTPIIALTANAIKGEDKKYLAAGMNDYVSKPFEQATLSHKMLGLMDTKEPELEETSSTTLLDDYVDLSKLRVSTNNDASFMTKMIQLFIDSAPEQIKTLQEHLDNNDLLSITKLSHSMKPSIDHLANNTLQNLIREIENLDNLDVSAKNNISKLISCVLRLIDGLKNHV